jgi:tryptophan-rich sensory protein
VDGQRAQAAAVSTALPGRWVGFSLALFVGMWFSFETARVSIFLREPLTAKIWRGIQLRETKIDLERYRLSRPKFSGSAYPPLLIWLVAWVLLYLAIVAVGSRVYETRVDSYEVVKGLILFLLACLVIAPALYYITRGTHFGPKKFKIIPVALSIAFAIILALVLAITTSMAVINAGISPEDFESFMSYVLAIGGYLSIVLTLSYVVYCLDNVTSLKIPCNWTDYQEEITNEWNTYEGSLESNFARFWRGIPCKKELGSGLYCGMPATGLVWDE